MAVHCGYVLIADGDGRFRAFVSGLFERAGFVTRQAVTGAEAVAIARVQPPGLVMLDVGLPDVSGFEACQQLRDDYGDDLPIIFVSGERTQPLDRATGLLVGGDDYLVKPVDGDELLARARRLLSRTNRGRGRSSWARVPLDAGLTVRELEVLRLLAEGIAPKEIARQLVVSPKTVASHVQRVLAKLGAHSRAEAVAIAYRDGFVTGSAATTGEDSAVTAHLYAAVP